MLDSITCSPQIAFYRRRHHHRQRRKEVFIPLSTDNEFLSLLANALASLAALQVAQKLQFTEAVALLAREVSNVSSPSRPKSDLYIWREIFSLWIEAEIFESERERDRGERTTEEVEKKLDWFVDQVAKRKLAKRMKNKESRAALDKFIQLNVQLLEMKKFQLANEEAARKIASASLIFYPLTNMLTCSCFARSSRSTTSGQLSPPRSVFQNSSLPPPISSPKARAPTTALSRASSACLASRLSLTSSSPPSLRLSFLSFLSSRTTNALSVVMSPLSQVSRLAWKASAELTIILGSSTRVRSQVLW